MTTKVEIPPKLDGHPSFRQSEFSEDDYDLWLVSIAEYIFTHRTLYICGYEDQDKFVRVLEYAAMQICDSLGDFHPSGN